MTGVLHSIPISQIRLVEEKGSGNAKYLGLGIGIIADFVALGLMAAAFSGGFF